MPFVQTMYPGELARPVLRKKPYPEDVPPVAAPGPVPQVQPVLQVQPEASLQPPVPTVPEVKPLIYGSQASRLLTAPQAPAAPAAQLPLRGAETFYGLPLGPAPEAVASAPAETSPSPPPPFQMNVDPPRPLPSEPEDAMEQQRAAHEGEMKRLEEDPVTARFAQQLRGLEADEKMMRENIRATLPEAEQEEMVKKLETELLFERLRVGKAMNQAVNAEAESLRTAAGIAHRKGQQAYEERMEAHEKSWAEQQHPLLKWANPIGNALQLPGPLNTGWWAQKVVDDFGPHDHQRKRVQQQVRSEEEAEVLRREAVKKTGLDPDNPEHARLLEDAKQMDWTAGGQQVGESAISGTGMAKAESLKNAMIQSLTEGKWEVNRAENSRLLADGSVVVNPLLIHDDVAYAKAVQEAQATPEAKRQAMDRLRDLQRGQAKALLPSLKSTPDFFPGEQFTDYVGRRAQEEPAFGVLPEAEQARLFLREQVQRGYGTRLADKLGTSFLLGTGDFFTQVNGGLAIATGGLPGVGEYFSQNAADLAMLGAMVDESTEARTGTGALGRVTGGVVRMLPPLVAQALITRGLRVNMLPEKAAKAVIYGLAGAQTAGGQYAALYGQLRQQGAGPMEAWLSASSPAMASGLATAGLTALGGATGTEALLLPGARGRVAQGVRGFWKEVLKNVPAHAMKEVPEEFFDEMASTVIEAMALGKDPKEALGGFLAESPEFIGSVMLLGGSGGLHSSRQQAQASAPVPLLPAQGGDRPVPIPPVAGAGGATGSAAEIQRPEASVPTNPPLPTRAPAPAPSGLPMAVGDEVGGPAPQTSPDPMPPGQPPQTVSNHPEMAQATAPASHRVASPAPPIWQGRARHGEDAAVLGRNPDGTFQVRLNGTEKTFKESQVAAMTGMQRGPLYAHLAQATRQQLALPHPPSLPPIWQGRARHGEDAAVLGRNPDGTFQVRLNGTEKTFKESQVAAMTGMQRGPLYEMLERATVGRMRRMRQMRRRRTDVPVTVGSQTQTDSERLKEPLEARWARKPLPAGTDPKVAEQWRQKLQNKHVPNPMAASDVFDWVEGLSFQDLRFETERAAQSLFDLLPREIMEKVGKVNVQLVKEIPGKVLGNYDANTNMLSISLDEYKVWSGRLRAGKMRELMWHELGHWLYHQADAHPRLKDWKQAIRLHWLKRVQGQPIRTHEEGWRYILDGWINEYAGRLYRGWAGGAEIPSVYLEEVSWGPERIAYHCRNKHQTETFDIVTSLFGSL